MLSCRCRCRRYCPLGRVKPCPRRRDVVSKVLEHHIMCLFCMSFDQYVDSYRTPACFSWIRTTIPEHWRGETLTKLYTVLQFAESIRLIWPEVQTRHTMASIYSQCIPRWPRKDPNRLRRMTNRAGDSAALVSQLDPSGEVSECSATFDVDGVVGDEGCSMAHT